MGKQLESLDLAARWMADPEYAALWPYGPPTHHEDCCNLHEGGASCDCKASDASDDVWGWKA